MKTNQQLVKVIVVLCVLLGTVSLHADAVTDWNAIMQATVASTNGIIQGRPAAIVQLAVFEAVNAIVGGYKPYLGTITAPKGASPPSPAAVRGRCR